MSQKRNVPDVIERRYDESIIGIITTIQWVIIALTLAFIVRCFFIEAFRIPTGSMAETLSGAHYHIKCDMCGYKYDLGTDFLDPPKPQCPICGYKVPSEANLKPSHGDRIFVQKSIYQITEPKRWDVVVFRYPVIPTDNYIKRLIALPGETVTIIDGDIYINGQIQRKPQNVQDELWMPLYDSDYVPYTFKLGNDQETPDDFEWKLPFSNDAVSQWNLTDPLKFVLDSGPDLNTLNFESDNGDRFRTYYAYNNTNRYRTPPICSDLKVEFFLPVHQGLVSVILEKYGIKYQASLDSSSVASIQMVKDDEIKLLQSRQLESIGPDGIKFEFSNADHFLTLKVNDQILTYDLGIGPDDAGPRDSSMLPQVSIVGSGKLELDHIAVYRDTHYTTQSSIRATESRPFLLGPDEFFVCGDNSMDSYDSRMWSGHGKGNYYITPDKTRQKIEYTPGVVPREYLIGKAFFLYWGNAFEPFEGMLPVIPNFSEMKLIHGGRTQESQ